MTTETVNQYERLTSDEFDKRLQDKLAAESTATLTAWLFDYAYEELVERYNNELLDEWEQDQEEGKD